MLHIYSIEDELVYRHPSAKPNIYYVEKEGNVKRILRQVFMFLKYFHLLFSHKMFNIYMYKPSYFQTCFNGKGETFPSNMDGTVH